jgi:hypothetical protein
MGGAECVVALRVGFAVRVVHQWVASADCAPHAHTPGRGGAGGGGGGGEGDGDELADGDV